MTRRTNGLAQLAFWLQTVEKIKAAPVRRCRTMHDCFVCDEPIRDGEFYHDLKVGKRAHVKCVDTHKKDYEDE
jgi:hypothetical protein